MIRKKASQQGLTFFELMVTAVILGFGMVMIYRGLLTALSMQRHMVYRAYAHNLINHKLAALQFAFQHDQKVPVDEEDEIENIVLNNNQVVFRFQSEFIPLAEFSSIQRVDMRLSWQEHQRNFSLSRTAYISKF